MTERLIFYTTDHCELCERAEQVLLRTPLETPIPVDVVDIAESESLVERYGTRIPVLQREPGGDELGWPFNEADVIKFIKQSDSDSQT